MKRPVALPFFPTFLLSLLAVSFIPGCKTDAPYARVTQITSMAQTIGGPAAVGRPGDYLLENDRLRAIIHGRHNERGTLPIGNGSLVDLDIQRPRAKYGNGRGRDAFYELGPMINLKINSTDTMSFGKCDAVGAAPCPTSATGDTIAGCVRVSGSGVGDTIFSVMGLLDLAIQRDYPSSNLQIVNDYDVCPGESIVRVTTTARFYGAGTPTNLPDLTTQTSLLDALLGASTGADCALTSCPPSAPFCDDVLVNLTLGTFSTEMKRCRAATDLVAGVIAGDFSFFSAKVHPFLPGLGFDHDSVIRSIFDSGGDVFSNPLSLDFVAATGDDVSYAYFNRTGKLMLPIFSESLTVAMTNRTTCTRDNPACFQGGELRFQRFVAVGKGDVASALDGVYAVRGVATGRVRGHVFDPRWRRPLSRADVFVHRVPAAWQSMSDAEIRAETHANLLAANLAETRSAQNTIGEAGIVSHFRTDIGLDETPDGSFSGLLPEGRYILVTRDEGRPASPLVPIQVTAGQTTTTAVVAGEGGTVDFEVDDDSGRALPSKLTVGHCFPECARNEDCAAAGTVCDSATKLCRPSGGTSGPATCRPDQTWDDAQGTCVCGNAGLLPLALGGKRVADGTVRTVLSASGRGAFTMEPGTYQVIVSRGIEYEIARRFVTVTAGQTTRLKATIPRVVSKKGWISADFHAHGPNSADSNLDLGTRVVSYAAEGVDLVTSTDHDKLTDFAPTIHALGLVKWLSSLVGAEISPLDYGHFIGFPLRYNQNTDLNGGFHWRVDNPSLPPGWRSLTPSEIYQKLRDRGSLGAAATAVFIAHFYDNFSFYNIDPFTLEPPALNITSLFNSVLSGTNFSVDVDALEGLNGKNFDIVRRPTAKEVRDYNTQLTALLARTDLDAEAKQRAWAALSAASQRSFLERTASEQSLAVSYTNANFVCRCAADADCGSGSLCDARTAGCVAGCVDSSRCSASLVAAGREACLAIDGNAARMTCQRVRPSCAADSECTVVWGGSFSEKCVAADAGAPTAKTCELPCPTSSTCAAVDPMRPVCDAASNQCVRAIAGTDNDPCVSLRGTVDDWFQMLNRGVRRTFIGNSDSHATYDIEAGMPRNYVRSNAATPAQIAGGDVVSAIQGGRLTVSYGPLVDFTVNGQSVGATVAVAAASDVTLDLKVEGPRWFDVDRIEVYRNGQLFKEVTGRVDCLAGATDCIKVPNDKIVKFEATWTDRPATDAWYVVIALGLDGKTLAPVYSSTPVARLGTFELIQRLTPLLPPLRSLRIPLSPTISTVRPFAMTNPIWVDVGDNGWTPPGAFPSWATAKDRSLVTRAARGSKPVAAEHRHGAHGSSASATFSSAPKPSHDHRVGLGRMQRDAKAFLKHARRGDITERSIIDAINSLRYMR